MMMTDNFTYPDIIGYRLTDAINVLKEYGIEILEIKTTAPPRQVSDTYNGNFRVLKVFAVDSKKINLLVCNPMID